MIKTIIRQMMKMIENRIKKTIIRLITIFSIIMKIFSIMITIFSIVMMIIFSIEMKTKIIKKNIIITDEKALRFDIERLIN